MGRTADRPPTLPGRVPRPAIRRCCGPERDVSEDDASRQAGSDGDFEGSATSTRVQRRRNLAARASCPHVAVRRRGGRRDAPRPPRLAFTMSRKLARAWMSPSISVGPRWAPQLYEGTWPARGLRPGPLAAFLTAGQTLGQL
ncbi:hypothetical protein OPV22_019041 [Ensete ventricosum]|uniref:Uncharacterized protein n=1 Tax=Ensete ventricosum TaxID=4639 RepID=A0AAV8QWY6_ENSVE|nr:hypothetical protein OPV22_019041 [Ensete ventricosum]